MAPERTIQGRALRELVELPQVVGGLDAASTDTVAGVFAELARQVVRVSSLEAAEMVKLANNCHTDLIYAYGNEMALIAERISKAKSVVAIPAFTILRLGLEKEVQKAIEALGCPFATTLMEKCVIGESHLQFAGMYAGAVSDPKTLSHILI